MPATFRVLCVTAFLAALGPLSSLTMTAAAAQPLEVAQATVIEAIEVRGAQRVDPGTVRSYMVINVGDRFDARQIDRSLKSLFATGLFADISLTREGGTLVVNVVENPVINRIAFEGNDEVLTETLEAEITLRPRVIYTRTKVQDDVRRILTIYRQTGLFAASVEPKLIQLEQNRIDLVFEINEGDETTINSIRFIGNREFSDGRLREVIQTRESAWWRFFSQDDVYDPDRLNFDRELLRRFYLSNGYADFRVTSAVAELTPDQKSFFITFAVDEGNRYQFGNLSIDARIRDLREEDLQETIEVEEGDWYSAEEIDRTIDRITEAVGTLGFAFVEVRPRINRDRENRKIDVTFIVNEGPRVFVERINISGNVRTLDNVVRREFRLVEGDAFNASKLRRSRSRLQNLAFFERVDIEQVPGSAPDKTIINATVEERPTGQISLGAGFSSSLGVLGDIQLRERNFMGRGQDLSLSLQIAAEASEIDLSFTEPYFLGRELLAGFDVFRVTRDLQDTSSFDLERLGFALRTSYQIDEYLAQSWRYTFRLDDVSDVDSDASTLIQAQEGEESISQVSHVIAYDRRDSPINPTSGYVVRWNTDLAGLGGTVRHLRNTANFGTFYSPVDQWVLRLSGKAGYILGLDDEVLLSERFFVGGDDVRGFETSGFGPRDTATNDALGGEWMYSGSVALSFPMGFPEELGVSGRVFTDLGSSGSLEPINATTVDESSLRMGAGFGVTWVSPFGPLGLDLAYPILKESFDEEEYVRFNFGARF